MKAALHGCCRKRDWFVPGLSWKLPAKEKGHGPDRNPLNSLEPAGGIEPSILADYESDDPGEFSDQFQ
jgi:hypothetical protein